MPEIPMGLLQKMPLLTMGVGESFFVSSDTVPLFRLRAALSAYSKSYRNSEQPEEGREHLGFITRVEEGGSRVWRYR